MSFATVIPKRPGEMMWFGLLCLGMMAGAVGVVQVLVHGHDHVYNVSREIPWGILISTYVFFVVSSTGLCLVSSLGDVWGYEKFAIIGRRGHLLALLTLCTGFGTMAMELNHPIRMGLYAVISPNFTSAIWWMGALYGFYMVCLIFEFTSLMRGWTRLAFWSALASGAALTVLIVYFNHKARGIEMPPVYQEFMYTMGKLQALFLGILLFFVVWKIIPGLYGQPPEKYETTMAWITGPLAFNFWFFELGLGILIPLIIVANRRTRTVFGVMIAGLLSTIGIFFMRYDLVIAGQMVSMRPEAVEGASHGLIHYFPSLTEIGIVVGAICLCLFLYSLAERVFDLEGGHRH